MADLPVAPGDLDRIRVADGAPYVEVVEGMYRLANPRYAAPKPAGPRSCPACVCPRSSHHGWGCGCGCPLPVHSLKLTPAVTS